MTTANTIRLDQLDARIRAVWSRGQTLHLLAGVLALVRWAVPLFLTAVLIDWLADLPAIVRGLVLVALILTVLYRAWRCGWRYLHGFSPTRSALQVESHYGDLNSLLVSAIQLRSQTHDGKASSALSIRTCELAEQAASKVQPNEAVPFKPLQRPAAYAGLAVAVIAIFATVNGPFLAAGATRIFTPWVPAEYPTNTQIEIDNTERIIKEGEAAEITAQLTGVIPEKATIYVRTGEGKARAIDLDVTANDTCTYSIASASRDFTYRIKAGDDKTGWQKVRVVPAPRIDHVEVKLTYPDYIERDAETIEALTLQVPEGTGVNWALTLDRPIKSARLERDGEEPIDLEVGSDGKALAFNATVSASQGYQFTWVDREHGFRFTSPRYFLQVSADQAPRVELVSPASNMVAMLGRPLDLSARVQDDHGIDQTLIAYRVNQRDEAKVKANAALQSGRGAQSLGWDYRETLTDLKIDDVVFFTVQVSDRYPGPQGAHVVRSETRRIKFLSKEAYLEQIEKKRDRLLSRVQTIYRQQRSAFTEVRGLRPGSTGYRQACQLEAIRQEMVRDQLQGIARQMRELLDDLAANNVSDAAEAGLIESARLKLIDIAEIHIARAATQLREQSAATTGIADVNDPANAAYAVNTAARELGALVLLRGIDSAMEVYARESRMLAMIQASLRWKGITDPTPGTGKALADRQAELAEWTARLMRDIQSGMRYEKRPLAVLRLTRSVKDLHNAQTIETMRKTSAMLGQGKFDQAAPSQAKLVQALLNAEFSVRLSGAYATLLRTRDLIGSLTALQQQLQSDTAGLSQDAFGSKRGTIAQAQTALRKQFLNMLLPTIPAPRANLFDAGVPKAPPVDALLATADSAMAQALSHLKSNEQKPAAESQAQAQQALSELLVIVNRWSIEMGLQSQGLNTVVAASSEMMSRIEEFEARTINLLDKTDVAAADNKKVDTLAESQQVLAADLAGYIKGLKKKNQEKPDRDLPPLLSRLAESEEALNAAVASLEANTADQAITQQEQAADALAEAYAVVVAQNERLTLLQGLLMFQRSVGFASGYMADIVAEQRDLLEATEASTPKSVPGLMPQLLNTQKCIAEVAPLLDLVAARLDVGTPLAFAQTDFEDAILSLQDGDKLDAVDAQDVAAESLAKIQVLVEAIRTETGYVAEIVGYLHQAVSETVMLSYRQQQLLAQATSLKPEELQQIDAAQRALLADADKHGRSLLTATGMPQFIEPAKQMRAALVAIKNKEAAAVAEQMELCTGTYAEHAESLLAVITMLHGLPQATVDGETVPEMIRLIDTLALASKQKQLARETHDADKASLATLADRQRTLSAALAKIAATGETHPALTAASKQLNNAAAAFQSGDHEAIRKSQKAGDDQLRHFIIDQSLVLDTAIPPPAPSDGDGDSTDGSDSESDVAAGFITDFVSGETPQDKKTEWKVLADRNRAALNQNFARELPLEYRGLLKNYYERIAR